MTVNSTAEMHIQWIEFVYNTTDSTSTAQTQSTKAMCANICSIDQTTKLGTPVLVQQPGTETSPPPNSNIISPFLLYSPGLFTFVLLYHS
jgi:hypothetical protein